MDTKSRSTLFDRESNRFVEIEDAIADLNPARKHFLGECADLVALVKDRLRGGVGFRDCDFLIVGEPEELVALKSAQVFGLGDERSGVSLEGHFSDALEFW